MPRFAPWYRRQDYALVREIMEDAGRRSRVLSMNGRRMPRTNGRRQSATAEIIPVFLDPDEFFTFCREKENLT